MRMVDVIEKKRDGFELTKEEIQFLIKGLQKVRFLIIKCRLLPWQCFLKE